MYRYHRVSATQVSWKSRWAPRILDNLPVSAKTTHCYLAQPNCYKRIFRQYFLTASARRDKAIAHVLGDVGALLSSYPLFHLDDHPNSGELTKRG